MRTRTLPVLALSAALAGSVAGPAGARPSDMPLHPSAPVVRAAPSQHLRSADPTAVQPGAAERAAAVPIPSARPATPVAAADDSGISTLGYGLLAAGGAALLFGAAYLGARFAGHAPRARTH
jgi:hypothetical protein